MSTPDHPFEVDQTKAALAAEELKAAAVETPEPADRNVPEPATEIEQSRSLSSKARQFGESTHSKLEGIKQAASERSHALKQGAEEKVTHFRGSAGEKVQQLRSGAGERAHLVRQEAEQKWLESRERAGSTRREAEDYVRANPLPTVVGAFAVGLLVGAILRR